MESAIVLPLFVFLVLGILQLGLMHQARLVTKYAAYKAVRAGALNNAKKDVMARAALAVLLPLISKDAGGGEYIKTVNSAADFQGKWGWPGVVGNAMLDTGIPYVEVTTCGPSRKEITGSTQEVDFDDPQVAASESWKESHRTKLRIQLTFNYRMPIPFANWVIHAIAFRRDIPLVLRMSDSKMKTPPNYGPSNALYMTAAENGTYVLPIRAAYTMRMHSNVYAKELPSSNSCRTTNRL